MPTIKEWELFSGVYFFADWGANDEIELSKEEADEVFNFYLFGDVSTFKGAD